MKKTFLVFLFILSISHCTTIDFLKYGERTATFKVKEHTIEINGLLGKEAYKRLKKTLQKHPNITTLVLMDVPGSIDDEYNLKMGRMVYDAKLRTVLTSTSVIASGGVDFFLSGQNRHIEKGAKIGVHSWTDRTVEANNLSKLDTAHHLFLDYYNYIDVDTAFYWFTLEAAPADDIHWMTQEEIEYYKFQSK